MSTIKAPYNFVPLNRKVYYPDWSPYISQDQPFSDGQSGFIEIEVESRTPIFIADGQLGQRTNSPLSFSNYNGRHLIPATSFKGMLRSVVEIMSYSKLGVFNQYQFAFRDLNNKELYMSKIREKNDSIKAGWLWKDGDEYYLQPSKLEQISFANIDEICDTNMVDYFVHCNNRDESLYNPNSDSDKSAEFKYEKFGEKVAEVKFFRKTDKGFEYAKDEEEGERGTIVFTGQPGLRVEKEEGKDASGKGKEFLFLENRSVGRKVVSKKVIRSFKQAYYDGDTERESVDWRYWSTKLKKEEKIPVFYNDGRKGEVKHMGISYLYKLPYEYGIEDLDTTGSLANLGKFDFAECIFGWVPNLAENAAQYQEIKGRVQVGHLWHEGELIEGNEIETLLASPKASYYPTYIEQELNSRGKVNRYNTYNDITAHLAGRKRYPVKEYGNYDYNRENKDVLTTFTPLNTGNKFKGRIYYHNLRLVELGAILSALTFHNSQGEYFHQIGMGKPLGLGAIKVSARLEAGQEQALAAMRSFESCMRQVDNQWLYSEPIKELLTMAKFTDIRSNELEYMKLGRGPKENEFTEAKNAKEGLRRYSSISGTTLSLSSLGSGSLPIRLQDRKESLLEKLESAKKMLDLRRKILKGRELPLPPSKPKQTKPFPNPQVKGLFSATLSYLDYDPIPEAEEEKFMQLFKDSFQLVLKENKRTQAAWIPSKKKKMEQTEFFKFLKKCFKDEAKAKEWYEIIVKS